MDQKFGDKVKEFRPSVALSQKSQEEIQAELAREVGDAFEIEEIKLNNEGEVVESNELAEGDHKDVAADEQQQEDDRQEGFRLDNFSKDRTGDKLRKNLLSRLTYEKIWLTP